MPSPWVSPRAQFFFWHLVLPGLMFGVLYYWLVIDDAELRIAQRMLSWEGGQWALQSHWLTEGVLHKLGRVLSGLAWLAIVARLAAGYFAGTGQACRRRLTYLALCVLCSVALVAGLKRSILSDCPWDMQGYGGERPFARVSDHREPNLPESHCFPAAHASSGYAWLALYFFGMPVRRRMIAGLALGLGLGLTFGLAQQLRGAHFASHDLWSAAICWVVAFSFLPILRDSASKVARTHGDSRGDTVPGRRPVFHSND